MGSSNTGKTFSKSKSGQPRKTAANTSNLSTQSSFTIAPEGNNGEISSESVVPPDNAAPSHMSSRDKLAIAAFKEKSRKRKSFAMIDVDDIENSEKIRALDRAIK